jgi:hypothetical protein
MKSTNAADRVRMYDTMDRFCTPERHMLYDPVVDLEKIDAVLVSDSSPDKRWGLAKVVTQLGKYGNQPAATVEKELVDFLFELAILCHFKSAIIFRFKDREMYWRIEEPEKLPLENNMRRGKSHTTYRVPIQYLKPV